MNSSTAFNKRAQGSESPLLLVEQELFTLPEQPSSPPVLGAFVLPDL